MNTPDMFPPFLRPYEANSWMPDASKKYPYIARYEHSQKLGRSISHCLWWPFKNAHSSQKTVLLFIPGNPGLADFYVEYLSHIRTEAPESLAILSHSLIGHSPLVPPVPRHFSLLEAQIESIVEAVDDIHAAFGPDTKVVLIGHSVGSWIVLQTLKERSDRVTAAFLLCPTIAHIARTPNGARLSWLFHRYVRRIITTASLALRLVPKSTLRLLFRDWPSDQVDVLWEFISSPSSIMASLTMAHQEMNTIKDLDKELFDNVKHKLYLFFAEKDDWVGSSRETLMCEMRDEPHSVRIVHGTQGVPHAYCINHGKEVGEQTLQWLRDDVFGLESQAEVNHKLQWQEADL